MLYVYGIHQGLLFQRTDTGVESDNEYIPHEVLREDDLIVLPVRVFVLVNPEEGSTRTQEDVNRVIDSASEIWDQAKIDLSVTQVEFIELDDEQVTSFFSNPAPQIRTIADPRPGEINLFLSRALSGLNGVAFRGLESVAVADYTTSFDFRVLAHEIGHVLNLDHISSDRSHLMYQGGHGTVIPYESAKKARTAAQKFLKQRE